jgi:N-acetylglucosamine kinase-like BadF-type ATPase
MTEYVVAVDAGNSKTDTVLTDLSGRVLARTRGPGVHTPLADPEAFRRTLLDTIVAARTTAGLAPAATLAPAGSNGAATAGGGPAGAGPAVAAAYYLANVDLPAEEELARQLLDRPELAGRTEIRNDTLAVLRAGSERGWGAAVVSGAGINAAAVDPAGRAARFLALGDITGDWGGGFGLGLAALGAAVRAYDGRGPATTLRELVPAHYRLPDPEAVAVAVHESRIVLDDLHRLAPLVFAAAASGDEVAVGLVDRLADEVILMVTALLRRLDLLRADPDVILGGGTLRAHHPPLLGRITAGIRAAVPRAAVRLLDVPPVYGAVVTALDLAGADPSARTRARTDLLTPPTDLHANLPTEGPAA